MSKEQPTSPCANCELPRHMRHCMESKSECKEWLEYQHRKEAVHE